MNRAKKKITYKKIVPANSAQFIWSIIKINSVEYN